MDSIFLGIIKFYEFSFLNLKTIVLDQISRRIPLNIFRGYLRYLFHKFVWLFQHKFLNRFQQFSTQISPRILEDSFRDSSRGTSRNQRLKSRRNLPNIALKLLSSRFQHAFLIHFVLFAPLIFFYFFLEIYLILTTIQERLHESREFDRFSSINLNRNSSRVCPIVFFVFVFFFFIRPSLESR